MLSGAVTISAATEATPASSETTAAVPACAERPPHDRSAHGRVGLADALAGGILRPEGDQHVEAAEVVEHGIRQLRAQRREFALGPRAGGPPPQDRGDAGRDQARRAG